MRRLWCCQVVSALLVCLSVAASKDGSDAGKLPVVLAYHHFVETAAELERGAPIITIDTFERHLQYLRDHRIRTLILSEYVAALSEPDPPKDAVLLTVDDGYESLYRLAYPLLKRYRMHATAFLVTTHVGAQNTVCPHQPWLDWDQCREMAESGLVDIEAHGSDSHRSVSGIVAGRGGLGPFLTTRLLDSGTGREETEEAYRTRVLHDLTNARQALEAHLGTKVTAFAWPYGKANAECAAAAEEAGYAVTFSVDAALPGGRDRTRFRSPDAWKVATSLLKPGPATLTEGPGAPASANVNQVADRPTLVMPPETPVPAPSAPARPRGMVATVSALGLALGIVVGVLRRRRRSGRAEPPQGRVGGS